MLRLMKRVPFVESGGKGNSFAEVVRPHQIRTPFRREKSAGPPIIPPTNQMRILWPTGFGELMTKKSCQVGGARGCKTTNVCVKLLQEKRAKFRERLISPKTPNFRFFKNVVTGEKFISTSRDMCGGCP